MKEQEQAYTDINKAPACPRCGDIFYHPQTVIEDYQQRAAEWEDEAKRAMATAQRLKAALEDIFLMMDEGLLVRNTDNDAREDWHLAAMQFLNRLKACSEALIL